MWWGIKSLDILVYVAVTEFLVKGLPKNERHGDNMYISGMYSIFSKFLIQMSPNTGFTLQKFSRMSMTDTVMIQV